MAIIKSEGRGADKAVIVTAEVAVAIATAADLVIKTETAADAAAAFIAKKFAVSVPTKTSSWIIKISA
jgi:hypothetical protein